MLNKAAAALEELQNRIPKVLQYMHCEKIPEMLYHYTGWATLKSVLHPDAKASGKNLLRLHDLNHFNDPNEGVLFTKDERVEWLYEGEKSAPGSISRAHILNWRGRNFSVYVCAFSKMDDRLDLWRLYGKDYKEGKEGAGCCLGIPTHNEWFSRGIGIAEAIFKPPSKALTLEGLRETDQTEESKPQFSIYQVRYGKDAVRTALEAENLEDVLEDLKAAWNKLPESKTKDIVREIARHLLAGLRYLYKSEEYETEHEFRLMGLVEFGEPALREDERNPPHCYVETEPVLFRDKGNIIGIGPRAEEKAAWELYLHHLLALNGWNASTQVVQSAIDYR